MSKKKNNDVYAYETKGYAAPKKPPFGKLYIDMLVSDAWQDLTPKAQVLYVYMKTQVVGRNQITDETGKRDEKYDNSYFYFNRSLYSDQFHLYGKDQQRHFNRDRDQLISHGFIEYVECGQHSRTKSIYRFSSKWWNWKEGDDFTPDEVKENKKINKKRYDDRVKNSGQ